VQNNPYRDLLSSWKDVQERFNTSEGEPKTVIFAAYSYEDYSGSAAVIYKKGRKFYLVEGSHCSCYGLEDQWAPAEYASKRELLDNLKREDAWKWRSWGSEMVAALEAYKS